MTPAEILAALRTFSQRERIPLTLGSVQPDDVPEVTYAPFAKYLESLAAHSKPETAAEEVFRALARDVCLIETFPQVFTGEGFVDFVLPEVNGSAVLVELKPLFALYDESRIQRKIHNPKTYLAEYQRIATALDWLNKLNVSGDLFDLPANVRDAAQFREDFGLLDKRYLLLSCVVRHLSGKSGAPRWMRLVVKTNLMREVVRLLPTYFHFRRFPGSRCAFSELKGWNLKRGIPLRSNFAFC